jgi:hypothetical protein
MAESVSRMQPRLGRLGRLGAGFVSQLLTVSACSAVTGSGQIDTETRQVSGFRGTVSYSGDASVDKSISGVGQLIKR